MTKPRRRIALTLATGALLLAGTLAAVWQVTEPEPVVADDTPLLTGPAPTTTAPALVLEPATTAPASQPVAVPADEYAPEPVIRIGTIEIPNIGLTHEVFHGITMRNIDKGPSHWPGSALPGQVGNAVFAGHRVTKTHPFRNIDKLREGDEVFFTIDPSAIGAPGESVRTRYVVTGYEVVPPTAMHIVDPTPTATATLFACHPPGSARQRYVVRLALANA